MRRETEQIEMKPMTTRFLGEPEVEHRTALDRVTIWRREKQGDFPRRRQISPGRIGWIEEEVEEWIRNRPVAE